MTSQNNKKEQQNGGKKWCICVSIVLIIVIIFFALMFATVAIHFDTSSVKRHAGAKETQKRSVNIEGSVMVTDMPEKVVDVVDDPWKVFDGKWDIVNERSVNMDKYMKEIGIPWVLRRLAGSVSYSVVFNVTGDEIKIRTINPFRPGRENEFHVNGPQTLVFGDNKTTYTAKVTWQNGKLIAKLSQSDDGTMKAQKVTRQVIENNDVLEMHQTMEIANIIAKQVYVKGVL